MIGLEDWEIWTQERIQMCPNYVIKVLWGGGGKGGENNSEELCYDDIRVYARNFYQLKKPLMKGVYCKRP